jgi:hypothetical protein
MNFTAPDPCRPRPRWVRFAIFTAPIPGSLGPGGFVLRFSPPRSLAASASVGSFRDFHCPDPWQPRTRWVRFASSRASRSRWLPPRWVRSARFFDSRSRAAATSVGLFRRIPRLTIPGGLGLGGFVSMILVARNARLLPARWVRSGSFVLPDRRRPEPFQSAVSRSRNRLSPRGLRGTEFIPSPLLRRGRATA